MIKMISKYFFLSAIVACGFLCTAEHQKQERALYSEYGITKPLTSISHSNELLGAKRLTGVGLIPQTSWVLIGTQKNAAAVINVKTFAAASFAPPELRSSCVTSMASAFCTNRIAYTTASQLFVGRFTPKSITGYRCSYAVVDVEDHVNTLAFDPTDSTVAGGCDDGAVRLWAVERAEPKVIISAMRRAALQRTVPIFALAYLDNNTMCYNSSSCGIVLHDLRSQEKTIYEDQHSGFVPTIATNIAHKLIVSGGADGKVRLFDVRQSRVIQQSFSMLTDGGEPSSPITSLAFHPSLQEFWVGQENGQFMLRRTNTPEKSIGGFAKDSAPISAMSVRDLTVGYCAVSVSWNGLVCFHGLDLDVPVAPKKSKKRKKIHGLPTLSIRGYKALCRYRAVEKNR